jgi:dGTPase
VSGDPDVPPRYARQHTRQPKDNREHAQRDRDRILYSSAFRRLAGVTQVVGADESDVFHNRLTHSLKVAQFGRRLAEKLRKDNAQNPLLEVLGIEPDVVEAAGLAHDIGHPPFGHVAEEELQNLTKEIGSFEGNAQSFRVLTRLAVHAPWDEDRKGPEYPGLDLTRATLNAVLKYPWRYGENGEKSRRKWGAYETETDGLHFARLDRAQRDFRKSVEAQLMDWADDVTYSVHDMEDFYRVGLIPLDRLLSDDRTKRSFFDEVFSREQGEAATAVQNKEYTRIELEQAFETIVSFIPIEEPYAGTQEQRCKLRNLTSGLIARHIRAVELAEPRSASENGVRIDPERRKEVIMGKELTWHFVINNPALASQQQGQRNIVVTLLKIFRDAAEAKRLNVFPVRAREAVQQARTPADSTRAIVDLVAGLTEQQAVAMYQRMTGASLGSVFNVLLHQ